MNSMKFLLLLCACLSGCAYTAVNAPNGNRVLFTQANADQMSYTGPGFAWSATGLNHSTPTVAGGASARNVINGVTAGVTAAGAAVATSGILH